MEQVQHPVIERPWEYTIILFTYNCISEDIDEHYIEMWLKKDSSVKKLRFSCPVQLKIEAGFPHPTHGMEILDISNRGMENINVFVNDFEASHGAISFYAKNVFKIV